MKSTPLTLSLMMGLMYSAQGTPKASFSEIVISDIADTLTTGMPVAFLGAVRWYLFNKIPYNWHDVPKEVADFIIETWKDQGFHDANKIVLKRIDASSVLARLVVYTQERPGALLVGEPFIQKLTALLAKKNTLLQALHDEIDQDKKQEFLHILEIIEDGLDELKFVCSHERVHKERDHIYKLLVVSVVSSFLVYSSFKHMGLVSDREQQSSRLRRLIENIPRTSTEFAIGWFFEHKFERDADLYASRDPKIIRAGLRLFKRALHAHTRGTNKQALEEYVLGKFFKYAHPSLSERIRYLEQLLKKIETARVNRQNSGIINKSS